MQVPIILENIKNHSLLIIIMSKNLFFQNYCTYIRIHTYIVHNARTDKPILTLFVAWTQFLRKELITICHQLILEYFYLKNLFFRPYFHKFSLLWSTIGSPVSKSSSLRPEHNTPITWSIKCSSLTSSP